MANGYTITHRHRRSLFWMVGALVAAGAWVVFGLLMAPRGLRPHLATPVAAATVRKPPPPPPKPKVMGVFTGEEFAALYSQAHYPKTQKIVTPPPITGDAQADTHIRAIATARGYQLRSIATIPLGTTIEGVPLQAPAIAAWQALKTAAQNEGLGLRLVAGYRTFEDQQTLFTRALANAGITNDAITSGADDATLNTIMQTVSIPGYSKHHTGYTVDIGCTTPGTFVTTPCFQWLSLNNYANAKKYGWIPSYPPNSGVQGPMPEPWEYVWVGMDALMHEE